MRPVCDPGGDHQLTVLIDRGLRYACKVSRWFMNTQRPRRNTMVSLLLSNCSDAGNITIRKGQAATQINMAYPPKPRASFGREGSIFIDSILSQDAAKDKVSMMIMANEYDDMYRNHLSGFCTSTQMGGKSQQLRPTSPSFSPLGQQDRPDYN